MRKNKEMAGDYEILQAVRLGGKEILLGYDPNNTEHPYMTSYRQTIFLGDQIFPESVGNNDYFTVMQTFLERLQVQVKVVEQFRADRNVPFSMLDREHCRLRGDKESMEGKLIILAPSSLAPEYRTADCQLGFALCGFGCNPDSRGRAVYFKELYSGEEYRWNVGDVLGIADHEKLPDWAKEKLKEYEKAKTEPKKERGEER